MQASSENGFHTNQNLYQTEMFLYLLFIYCEAIATLFPTLFWIFGFMHVSLKNFHPFPFFLLYLCTKGPIIWEKLVHFQTVPKSDCSFTWLCKILNSYLSKTYEPDCMSPNCLRYMSPNWLTLVNWFTPQDWTSSPQWTIKQP